MAKEIRGTPELVGKEAEDFLRRMIVVENTPITKEQKDLCKSIERDSKFFAIC